MAQDLKEYVRSDGGTREAVVITGDIAECHSLLECLDEFITGVGKPVYFVLGNHDIYGGSFEATHMVARAIQKGTNNQGTWLTEAGVIELTPGVALVGHDGWYDGRNGSGERSGVDLNDFYAIEDFIVRDERGMVRRLHQLVLIERIRAIADAAVKAAEGPLREAAKRYKEVYFATHVPPFVGATWHMGRISDGDWLPWMSCKAMGDMLIDVAYDFPEVNFTVMCGHTHSPGEYTPIPNLSVLTAKATYGHPSVHRILEV